MQPGRKFCQLGRENLGQSLNQAWGGSSAQVEEEQDALERSGFGIFVGRGGLALVCGLGRKECCGARSRCGAVKGGAWQLVLSFGELQRAGVGTVGVPVPLRGKNFVFGGESAGI